MAFVISGVVKYYNKNDYLIVGDNVTLNSGITDPSYSGEVVIQERVDRKEVKEIGSFKPIYSHVSLFSTISFQNFS